MGCFDSTCSISHIPVHHGDETVILYVGADPSNDYRPFVCDPIMLPVFGKYNDYGELEDIDEDSIGWRIAQYTITNLFKDVIKPKCGMQDPWEIFKDSVHMNSSQCLPDQWARGKCEFVLKEPPSYNPDGVEYEQVRSNGTVAGKMFIHRKVYDYMVQSYMNTKQGFGKNAIKFKTYLNDIPEFIQEVAKREKLLAEWQSIEDADSKDDFLESKGLTTFQLFNFDNLLTIAPVDDDDYKFGSDNYLHPLAYIFKRDSEIPTMNFHMLLELRNMFQKLCSEGKLDEAEELLRALLELHCFVGGLKTHNQEIAPYGGFAYEQYQEPFGANNMVNMFNVFQEIQGEKIRKYTEDSDQ